MNTIEIRNLSGLDTDLVHALAQELPPLDVHTMYTYWNILENFGDSCFVATDSDLPVGLVTSHPTTNPSDEWFLWQIGVRTEYRGNGIADRLQDCVVAVARDAGASALRTTIDQTNLASLHIFERLADRLDTPLERVADVRYGLDKPSLEDVYRINLNT